MNEPDAYRIAVQHASPVDVKSFQQGWLSALVWVADEVRAAVDSATSTLPLLGSTADCPHCGWATTDEVSPQTLRQLHLRHQHGCQPSNCTPAAEALATHTSVEGNTE